MGNPVVHFEITGTDGPALEKFYADLFGWQVQSVPEMNYGMVDTLAGNGINGGIGTAEDGKGGVTFYVEAPDLQAVLDKAGKLGGKTVTQITAIPDVVTIAQFADLQGNVIGLVQGDGTEQGGPSKGDGRAVGWFEVLGTDAKALQKFYAELFDWKITEDDDDGQYGHVDTGTTRGISGGVGKSRGEPAVTVYADVDDVTKYLERAESLGAKKVMEEQVSPQLKIGAFRDPQGNLFGVFTFSK